MVVSSRCAGPRPKMPGERARFAFLGQSAADVMMQYDVMCDVVLLNAYYNYLLIVTLSDYHVVVKL